MKRKAQVFISDWFALLICIIVMILVLYGVSMLISSFKNNQTEEMEEFRGDNFKLQNLRTFLQSEAYYNGEFYQMYNLVNIYIDAKKSSNSKKILKLEKLFKEQEKNFFKSEYKFYFYLADSKGEKISDYAYSSDDFYFFQKQILLIIPYKNSLKGEKIYVGIK